MPGPYGRIYFTQSTDNCETKPVRSGSCVECGTTCYRETYISGRGWIWRCYACDPSRPVVERRLDTKHRPMGYVPKEYDRIGKEEYAPKKAYERMAKAEEINAGLKAGNLVARRGPSGKVVENFKVRVH